MIPISLVVTMGMVKAAQGIFIGMDYDMYHSATKTLASVRTSDLNEELGQVQFIFSDKTGTLTQNCMELRKCCISGISYGRGMTEVHQNMLRKQGLPVPPQPAPIVKTPHVNLDDPELEQKVIRAIQGTGDPDVLDFFVHLAVNHSVVVEAGSNETNLTYSFSSPDEGSLVYGARHFHVRFLGRSATGVKLDVLGRQTEITILAALEFNSTRKRSSVLCKIPKHGLPNTWRYALFCKGADMVIAERLKTKGTSEIDAQTLQIMESYAADGLE